MKWTGRPNTESYLFSAWCASRRVWVCGLGLALASSGFFAAGKVSAAPPTIGEPPDPGSASSSWDELDRTESQHEGQAQKKIKFDLVRSAGVVTRGCLPNARGRVKISSIGPVEIMRVEVEGLPPNTEFDFFVIQVPNPPFGLAWYQGDIKTDDEGEGKAKFIGRFNIETFIVAPGIAPAPVVHDQGQFRDANTNPQTSPVHTFHLGLWFNSPADAMAAGCLGNVTPFNGDHTAGIQVLNTSNFPDDQGPLRQLTP